MIYPTNKGVKIFGIGPAQVMAQSVCIKLGLPLYIVKEEEFPDGELKVRPHEEVRNADVFVFHSLGGDSSRTVNDRLCELYFLLCTLRDNGARRITALIPYLPYARSDQRKEHNDSVINRYVAQMLEQSGVYSIVTIDIHNISAFENAFRCPVVNLEAAELFCDHILLRVKSNIPPVVISPDIGGIKRAEIFRNQLESQSGLSIGSAFMEKFRTSNGLVGKSLVGDVRGRPVFIVDDMISTGETILRASEACRKAGSGPITVFASHGIFSRNQQQLLYSSFFDEVVVTDSHPAVRDLAYFPKLRVLPCASVFSKYLASSIEKM